jgi:hypothetical protein
MQSGKRELLRLAHAIHAANVEASRPPRRELPEEPWREGLALARRLEFVEQKGWKAAADQVRRDLDRTTGDLQRQLASMRDSLRIPPPTPFASPAEIFADLLAIDEEFDEFTWNGKEHTIAVSTPPIAFDDVPLGRFGIELRWNSLRPLRLGCYHVIAREPNPAGTDESVTHPHVQDEFLCEGEAQTAIQRALSQGWTSLYSFGACWTPTTPPTPTCRSRTGRDPLRRLRRVRFPQRTHQLLRLQHQAVWRMLLLVLGM